ncbi:hypothetical protein [Mycolicibacterium baixiangningiae]|nr:hypothetical protein [Mycolicibacterium baixiangningiae]
MGDTALYVGGTGWPGTPTHSQMTWLRYDVYAGRDDTWWVSDIRPHRY